MKTIKNSIVIFAVFGLFLNFPVSSFAHNGGLDELGGHFRSADCVYMLHDPTPLAESAINLDDLIQLINQYNQSDCSASLNKNSVELEGFSFSDENESSSEPISAKAIVPEPSDGKVQLGNAYEAKLVECTDGDTAVFNINGFDYKTRFLYIDTPESTREREPFGAEAAQFTCSFLKQGNIILETDGGTLFDKYDRLLAWVWVGDKLHQEEITRAGLVEDFYDYSSYRHEVRIWDAMEYARKNGKGMYGSSKPESEGEENIPSEERESVDKEESPENKQQEDERKTEEDTGKTEQDTEKTEGNKDFPNCGIFTGIIAAVLFYLIRPFKKAFGMRTLIAHRMWSKKWWLNLILGVFYAALCFITLTLLIVEAASLFKGKKRRR